MRTCTRRILKGSMCTKIDFADLTKLFERLGSCLTVVKPLELVVTEVYDVIKLLETLKYIQISDGTQLWRRLFEELVESNSVIEISTRSTADEPQANNCNQLAGDCINITQEDNVVSSESSLIEQSAEEVVRSPKESEYKETPVNEVLLDDDDNSPKDESNNDEDVVIIEVESGVTPAGKDDSWDLLYQHEESSSDNDSFELFIMEVKQKRNIKSTPYTTPQDSTTAYFTANSVIPGLHVDEVDVKKSLFEEISNSVHTRRSLSRRKSFTHVTITEDCIEAEEYLEDDGNPATEESDVAKKLFSDEEEVISSFSQSPLKEKFLPTPFCTPVSIMENLKTTYCNVNFNRFKVKMAQDLFCFYNVAVFDSKLPEDFEITWNIHLTKTAGLCYYSRVDNKKTARIELSTKVCTDFERLRDVLIHELCHAATWVLDGVKCGHGLQWKSWTQRACQTIPGLPVVHTCHQYEIHTKHTYHCTQCDYSTGRHSKSINLTTQRCPLCTSQLKLQPKLKADGTPRKQIMSPFAKFVKENYSSVRGQSPRTDHGQVMSKLAMMYKQNCTV